MARKETDTPPAGGTPTQPTGDQGGMPPATKVALALMAVVLLGAVGSAGYFYKQLAEVKKNPNKVAQDEVAATLAAVGKLIVLPEGEQPTLATVSDLEKLKDQAFFASAKVGDKVLIYTNAKKAILYSPTENKIVEVAPINIGTPPPAPAVSGASTTKKK